MKLEKWAVIEDSSNPFLTPELRSRAFVGEVCGNPGFEDGASVQTSRVKEIVKDPSDENKLFVHTRNSIYEINRNDVHPEYESQFNGSFDKLYNQCVED